MRAVAIGFLRVMLRHARSLVPEYGCDPERCRAVLGEAVAHRVTQVLTPLRKVLTFRK
jgi:hypothetical protein